jgi:hypothetical protein
VSSVITPSSPILATEKLLSGDDGTLESPTTKIPSSPKPADEIRSPGAGKRIRRRRKHQKKNRTNCDNKDEEMISDTEERVQADAEPTTGSVENSTDFVLSSAN